MENTNELSELKQEALSKVSEYFKDSLKATTKEALKQNELTKRGKEAKALQLLSQLYELGYEYYNADGTPVIKIMQAGQLKAEDMNITNEQPKEEFLEAFNRVGKQLSDQNIRMYAAEVDRKLIQLPMEDRIGILKSIIKHSEVNINDLK